MMVLLGIAVFASATAIDFAATRYNRELRDEHYFKAALWSIVMCLLTNVALLAYLDVSRWMIVPECLGFGLGTCLGGLWARFKRLRRLKA